MFHSKCSHRLCPMAILPSKPFMTTCDLRPSATPSAPRCRPASGQRSAWKSGHRWPASTSPGDSIWCPAWGIGILGEKGANTRMTQASTHAIPRSGTQYYAWNRLSLTNTKLADFSPSPTPAFLGGTPGPILNQYHTNTKPILNQRLQHSNTGTHLKDHLDFCNLIFFLRHCHFE